MGFTNPKQIVCLHVNLDGGNDLPQPRETNCLLYSDASNSVFRTSQHNV